MKIVGAGNLRVGMRIRNGFGITATVTEIEAPSDESDGRSHIVVDSGRDGVNSGTGWWMTYVLERWELL
jgi:hypothetical protein